MSLNEGYAAYAGCCFWGKNGWGYLPQVSLKAHATILSSNAARTTLTQTFFNSSYIYLQEIFYTFPLYDGVSIVGFKCRVGSRELHSQVKTRDQAQADYNAAVANQRTAGLLDHSWSANDVFTIRLGNVPLEETVTVDITFVGELKQDAQMDGIRYTLPNSIAPRYGNASIHEHPALVASGYSAAVDLQGISITVDVLMAKNLIRELMSPSHSVKVSLGRISSTPSEEDSFDPSQASVTLRLAEGQTALLERDFVLVVKADGLDNPCAILETHPTLPGQRALMATLVPKFSLPPAYPEVVLVIDRSGSMHDKIPTLQEALRIVLKSLPVGICFNICSFGTSHEFLWPTSRVYDASSLSDALSFVSTISANMMGTEMASAIVATVTNRLKEKDLEVLVLTDGEIWNQEELFSFVRKSVADHTVRFFSLAIGDSASHSLVEGIARSGNGFSQSVLKNEELDRKVVRMLKGALTPHIFDYTLKVEYDGKNVDDFEVVDTNVSMDTETQVATETSETPREANPKQPISLFDPNFKESDAELGPCQKTNDKTIPNIVPPREIQAPCRIPPLFPFIRTAVYLLLDPRASHLTPKSLTFSATSKVGPLELQIPVTDSGKGETIHQLASRKAVIELEENHGWLQDARDEFGTPFKQLHADTRQHIVARECQRLGLKYQVTGKHCSFVAVETDASSTKEAKEAKPASNQTQTLIGPAVRIVQSSQPIQHVDQPYSYASAAPSGVFGFGGAQRSVAPAQHPPFKMMLAGAHPAGASMMTIPAPRQSNVFRAPPPPPPPSNVFRAGPHPPPPPPLSPPMAGLFGAPSSTGGFGSSTLDTRSQPIFGKPSTGEPSAHGIFGSSTQDTKSQLLFGKASSDVPSSTGIFGSSTDDTRSQPLFGKPSSGALSFTKLFGSPTQDSDAQPLFGKSNPGAGIFGSSAPATHEHFSQPSFTTQENNAESAALLSPSKVHVLVGLQQFEGNWEWSQSLFDVLECDQESIRERVLNLIQCELDDDNVANIISTLLALGFLANNHAESRSLWELVYGKAEAWISNKLAQAGSVGDAIEAHKGQIMALVS